MEALNGMKSFLRGRPAMFKSLEHAIEWRWVYCLLCFTIFYMNILCKLYVCIKKKILINTHLHMFLYKYVFISAQMHPTLHT